MSKVALVEIIVGSLPEWYLADEENYDVLLEKAIERQWHRSFPDAEISVVYNYQTDEAVVKAYDQNGDLVFERDDHDIAYALDYAHEAGG